MKNAISIIIFILFSVKITAQYHPLISEDKLWVIVTTDKPQYPPMIGDFVITETYHYYYHFFSGDTLINGITYKKIYKQQFFTSENWYKWKEYRSNIIPKDTTLKNKELIGCLREDTTEQKVFSYGNSWRNSDDMLIFNFKLNQGDTINELVDFFNENYCRWTQTVKRDSTVQIKDQSFRKTIYFSHEEKLITANGVDWFSHENAAIEGIGGLGGIIPACTGDPVGGGGYTSSIPEINCYSENGKDLYGICNYKYWTSSLEDINFKTLTISPNPSNGQINISGITEETQVEIFNISGQQVFSTTLNSEKVNLDLSALNKGYFIVNLRDKKGNQSASKLVLQ